MSSGKGRGKRTLGRWRSGCKDPEAVTKRGALRGLGGTPRMAGAERTGQGQVNRLERWRARACLACGPRSEFCSSSSFKDIKDFQEGV